MGSMNVTLLNFDDRSNRLDTQAPLRAPVAELPGIQVPRHIADTPEGAGRTRFRGWRSILFDGVDPSSDADAPVGLSCRVDQTPEGPAGSPTIDQLREVLADG